MLSFFKKKDNTDKIGAPCKGLAIPLSEVNDPTFSEEMIGPGAAVIPQEGKIVSPVDGEIGLVFETLHAISITADNGAEILIHVGLDTVKRNGEGFISHVAVGQKVKKGDLLLTVDLEALKADGYDVVTPVIVCNSDEFSKIEFVEKKDVEISEDIIAIKK